MWIFCNMSMHLRLNSKHKENLALQYIPPSSIEVLDVTKVVSNFAACQAAVR